MFKESMASSKNIEFIQNKKYLFLFILMLMSTAGLVGSDVYLPVLPEMGAEFQKNTSEMQLTLGIYLLGLSIGQLFLGPLTDRFGRKSLLIFGMALYLIASLACAFSTTYFQILIARFFQAIGACSGLIIGRAIVGDLYSPKEAGKIFSTIFPFVGMSPAISPFIGGIIGYYFGWQATFIFIGFFAIAIAVLSLFYLPETLLKENQQSLHLIKIVSAYPKLLFNKKFIAYASAPCFAYIAYFAYLTQSPFIFNAAGFDERAIGSFYITLALTYVIGNISARILLERFDLDRVLHFGYITFVLGGFLILFSAFVDFKLIMMVASISILTLGNGFLIPLGIAGVIGTFSKSAGYASGLLGFLQLGVAAVTSSFIDVITDNSILKLGIFILFTTIIGSFLFNIFKEKGVN